MENKFLEIAAVQIVAYQQKLLQEPDPTIADKPLLRVPSGCGYTVEDWEACWAQGKIDFEDQYALSHQGKLPSKENLKACGDYLYCNRLDPQDFHNWEVAWTRLRAADVIKVSEAATIPLQDKSQAPKKLTPQEFAKEVAEAMEKIDTRTPEGRKQLNEIRQKYLLMEAGPVYDRFIADLESRGVYLTRLEQQQLLEWVQNNNLVLTQRQSFEMALRACFPKYLTEEAQAEIAIDRDDGPATYVTAADLKKALGTARPRVGYAVQNR